VILIGLLDEPYMVKWETKKLFSTSTIYSVGNILVKLVAFILIPLYARRLVPEEYGIVAILELIELIGKTIFVYGLGNSILRFFVLHKSESKENEFIFSILSFLLLANSILLGWMYLFPQLLVQNFLTYSAENILYFRYILIVIFVGSFQRIFVTLLQSQGKALHYILFMLGNFLLLIALNIYKVGVLNQGVQGIVEAKLYVALLNFIILNIYFLIKFKPKISVKILIESLKYSLPLIFVGISLTLMTLADRYLLKILKNMAEVGIYTMAYKFGMVMNMVLIVPFRQAFFPLMFELFDKQDVKKIYIKFFSYFLVTGIYLFLMISIFAKEILIITTTKEYVSGYIIIPFITFSYLLLGLSDIFINVLASRKETKVIAYITVLGAVLNIVLNLFFIPCWGFLGAAIATLISYAGVFVIMYYYQQKSYYVKWDWKRAQVVFIISIILYLLSIIPIFTNSYYNVIWKFMLILSFPVILYFSSFFKKEELDGIKKVFNHLLKIIKMDIKKS
jgi:O-antigen/teichoic acid export membrane protein